MLGTIRNIRVRRHGDEFCIAFCNYDTRTATILWCSLAELRAMPPVNFKPEVAPNVPIINLPPTKPEPPIMSYQPQAPDIRSILRQATRDYPVEWAEAYEYDGHPRTDRFVKIAAALAFAHDPRFGLNGKRGGDELSMDALSFKNPTVPAICGSVEIRDFIYDDGKPGEPGARHEIVWSDVTIVPGMRPDFPNGAAGKWIQPPPIGAAPKPEPGPGPTPAPPSGLPNMQQWLHEEFPQLVAAYQERHGGNEPNAEWAAFQTARRGGVFLAPGEAAWSFARMLETERNA